MPRLAWARSPLAVAGVLVSALSAASFRMVGPVYAAGVGLEANQIAVFLATYVAGGALSQYPVGWLADKFDRRWVLIWLSVASLPACALTAMAGGLPIWGIMGAAMLFGLVTFPIYSVSAAHAHDFADTSERVELSAALMFWYAVGAIAAPLVASVLIGAYGPPALFALIAAGHVVLVVFGLYRMQVRKAQSRTACVYTPRTAFLVGRRFARDRD